MFNFDTHYYLLDSSRIIANSAWADTVEGTATLDTILHDLS